MTNLSTGGPRIDANGARIPALGLGTWTLEGEGCAKAVAHALACGYRHIDTATMYGNEAAVGEGLRASGVARDEVFVTTKVWMDQIRDGDLQRSAEASLKRLGLARVDLLLIHWPNPDIALKDSIRALCDAKRRGLAAHVGVSNFPVAMLDEAVALASEKLCANQVEYHPRLDQGRMLAACRKHGMALTSYCPLGRGDLVNDASVARIAKAHGRTPAQIVLRWHVQQQGVAAIPKSGTPAHIEANFQIFDFVLADAEMAALSGLGSAAGRMVTPAFAPKWDR